MRIRRVQIKLNLPEWLWHVIVLGAIAAAVFALYLLFLKIERSGYRIPLPRRGPLEIRTALAEYETLKGGAHSHSRPYGPATRAGLSLTNS